MRRLRIWLAAGVVALAAGGALAEEAGHAGTSNEASSTKDEPLTPEEKAEKEARKACKVEICGVLASKDANGADISCAIVKTWREKDIGKMLGGRFEWPWGNAVCQSKLELKRADLARAMSEDSAEVALGNQKIRCTLAQKGDAAPYEVDVSIAPKVSFEKGKAVKAKLNWGEASGPMLVYALIYAGTGADNSANVLGPQVVRMVNEFTGKKCAEVRKEQSGAPAP